MSNTLIIAECASSHQGKLDIAIRLAESAIMSGANAVKFQLFTSNKLYSSKTPDFAGYKNIPEMMKKLELKKEWLPEIKSVVKQLNRKFIVTAFDEHSIDYVANLGVDYLKIAGFESTDPRIVKLAAKTGLPLIVSIGIRGNARQTVDWIMEENSKCELSLLHCNNGYPTNICDVKLDTIDDLYKLGFPVGLSDHTDSTLVPALAVIKGAKIIEKHFTLSNWLPDPDSKIALEPQQFDEMVDNIRDAERCFGRKRDISQSEKLVENACRSIIATEDILPDDLFTLDNLSTIRSFEEGQIEASRLYEIIGKKSATFIPDGYFLHEADILQ